VKVWIHDGYLVQREEHSHHARNIGCDFYLTVVNNTSSPIQSRKAIQ